MVSKSSRSAILCRTSDESHPACRALVPPIPAFYNPDYPDIQSRPRQRAAFNSLSRVFARMTMSYFEQQKTKFQTQDGFIAALDQSGGSTPKALKK